MGACIGKKNRTSSKRYRFQVEPPKIEEITSQKEPSPILLKKMPELNCTIEDHNGGSHLSSIEPDVIDVELENVLDEQSIINEILSQPLTSRVVSATESQLEVELANLIHAHLQSDNAEDSSASNTKT